MSVPPITPEVQPQPELRRRLHRHRMFVKLGCIAGLALILLIPLGLLLPVVEDRAQLRNGAVQEIEQGWGHSQTVIGPVLVLPVDGGYVYAFPDELRVQGEIAPQERKRGIYAAVVYSARIAVAGTFHRPTAGELGVAPQAVHWEQAYLALAVSDLRGTGSQVALQWGSEQRPMLPGSQLERWPSGLHAPVAVGDGPIAFSLDLPVHGSEGVRFAPLGVRNEVTVRSAWPNPSFGGAFLPATRELTDDGFTATWNVSYYGRDFGQHGRNELPAGIDSSLFGVDLLPGIDSYRSVQRAVKYGVLFVVLAFMSWFLFEVIARVRIHPFQYGMVGLALGVFFLVLLALSEVVAFGLAYGLSAAATVGLVAMYMLPVLRTGRRTAVASALLATSFGILYLVLQAEDFALLAGSLVVFAALAITMQLTRRLEWYTAEDGLEVDRAADEERPAG